MERRIITGLITSTDFCNQIKDIWSDQLLESTTAKRMAGWCWEYFGEYKKAPGKDIEPIFFKKIKDPKFPKDIAEEIEQDILPGLSKEYENSEFNLDFLVRDTKKFLQERHLAIHHQSIEALLQSGKADEAEKMALEFKPLLVSSTNLHNFILSVHQLRLSKKGKSPMLMKPWLREGQTTIIYGDFGTGKTLLVLAIAYLLGLKDYDSSDCEIGTWEVVQPTGTLYIDGEMGEQEMLERITQYGWLGAQENKYRIRVLSIPEYQMVTEDSFYLSIRANQLKIIQWLKENSNYKLIILDSASTLFGLEEENDNSEWNKKMNPFLRDLRALGVACLLLHHSGKSGKKGLRGASAMGAMAQNIFRLNNHTEKSPDDGEAWFFINKDKQRSGGKSFKTFALRFHQSDDSKDTHWEVT